MGSHSIPEIYHGLILSRLLNHSWVWILFPHLYLLTRVLEVLNEVMWSGSRTGQMLEQKVYSCSSKKGFSSGLMASSSIVTFPVECVGGDSHFLVERSKSTKISKYVPQFPLGQCYANVCLASYTPLMDCTVSPIKMCRILTPSTCEYYLICVSVDVIKLRWGH